MSTYSNIHCMCCEEGRFFTISTYKLKILNTKSLHKLAHLSVINHLVQIINNIVSNSCLYLNGYTIAFHPHPYCTPPKIITSYDKIEGCVPMGSSRSGSLIQDHLHQEPFIMGVMNPCAYRVDS